MALLSLEDMRFYGYHGVYEEERLSGNYYIVDVYIETAVEDAAMTDELGETINYETVYLICQSVMRKPVKLIEKLIFLIIDGLKHQFSTMQEVRVRVRKENPIPGEPVGRSAIEVSDSFVQACPRCGTPFICYGGEYCTCTDKLYSQTLASLRQQYQGCLCENCVSFFAG
ncbi:MAG: dihydroneopterin aldolase [Bacteroidota bacterium]